MILCHHQVQVVKTVLPYHQLMAPSWLHKHSTISGLHSLNPQYLEFLPSTVNFQQLLQVQLVEPDVLTGTDCISVTLTIAMDTALADGGDHDPLFGISDGKSFVGFQIPDKDNYPRLSPCYRYEGDNASGVLTNGSFGIGPLVTSRSYSSEIKLQIRPTEQWGSCHTEHDEGYTNVGNYKRKLDLTNGLYLEMYREHAAEDYRIKYIVVDVNID